MILAPTHLSPDHEIFYLSTRNSIKVFHERNATLIGNKNTLPTAAVEFKDHIKGIPRMVVSNNRESLITFASDGFVTVRTLIEPEKSVKCYSHDINQGGVINAAFSRDIKHLITVGNDGILRRFDWKFNSQASRRSAVEGSDAAEALAEYTDEKAEKVALKIKEKFVIDINDLADEKSFLSLNLDMNNETGDTTKTEVLFILI
jgi:WD40 repeat protein